MGSVPYGAARAALLRAAVRVVARRGLRGLTYRAVAAEAGVTHGSVQYHFGSWEALVEEALEDCVTRGIDDIDLGQGPGFESLASGLVAMVAHDPDAQAFQFELYLEGRRRPELAAVTRRVNDRYRRAVRDVLVGSGLDDADLAELVFVTLDGLVFHQTTFGETERVEGAVRSLRRLLGESARAGSTSVAPG